jgi:hypothetical protein
MANYLHEPTILSENEKRAYRYLLYMAMVQMRNMLCESPTSVSVNPLTWRKKYLASRIVGGLTDWLHNLAGFVSKDFLHFNATTFWRDYDLFATYYYEEYVHYHGDPKYWMDYRKIYHSELARLEKANLPVPFYDSAIKEPVGEVVDVERVYCLSVNDFSQSDWDKLSSIYQSLPHFMGYSPLPFWFGTDEHNGFHLSASVESTGIQVNGFLPLEDWLGWDKKFRMTIVGMPYYDYD